MFHERQSKAFVWLSGLCNVFVALCSLGLNFDAQAAIKSKLAEIELILDTDIVLSLLCEGEPDRDAVLGIVKEWRKMNGAVRVPPAVLEEAAHHAWISARDFNATWRIMGTMSDADASHLIRNVFVRGFRVAAASKRNYAPRIWEYYIKQFRGSHDHDHERILGLLRNHGIDLIDERDEDYAAATNLAAALFQRRQRPGDSQLQRTQLREKCDRDGRMIALLIGRRKAIRAGGRSTSIVSSAGVLRDWCALFKGELGPPEPVMSLGAVAWMLSQVPDVVMNARSVRAVLFDVGFAHTLTPDQRDAMRAVQASEQYTLSWSRRDTLERAIRDVLPVLAKQRGRTASEARDEFRAGSDEGKQTFSEAVAQSIDQMVASKYEREVAELKKKIRELESRGERQ
jgi:hypothetical protein